MRPTREEKMQRREARMRTIDEGAVGDGAAS